MSKCVHVCVHITGSCGKPSVLKSRDVTLLTKVHVVKAMVFFSSHY